LKIFDEKLSMNPKQPYRLISYASYDAAMNMAIDEAILEAHLAGHVPPTLRIYQFSPPAVSFGYAQKVDDNLIAKIKKQNLAVVRRPTGGRAVLHMGDITYAFICSSKGAPVSEYALVGESIAAAYKQICQALILALNSLGVQTALGHKNGRYQDKHDCFAAVTAADLQHQGKKIVGSAQLRRRHAVLQHGSIILYQPQSLLPALLNHDRENGDNIQHHNSDNTQLQHDGNSHHASLYDILGCRPGFADLGKALKHGFELAFENQFLAAPLTSLEEELTVSLLTKHKRF